MLRKIYLSTAVLALVAMPLAAQIIPAGEDRWVTPATGQTKFSFPSGDVESLCGAPVSAGWDHQVLLTGVPEPGWDWDTSVARLTSVSFSATTTSVSVPIQVKRLEFRSLASQRTPCGLLDWHVKTFENQPITKMKITKTSSKGGVFYATISVRVVFEATDAQSGASVGKLFYTLDLPDNTGVPWSFDPSTGVFRPGIDTAENCIDVLRQKLLTATGSHVYFIENMIAQGRCDKRN